MSCNNVVKRGRDEGEEEYPSMLNLMQNRQAIIPELSLDNAGLQSSAHTEDTGHDDATILTGEAVDIRELLANRNVYFNCRYTWPSHLLSNLRGRSSFVYQNETEIRDYVKHTINDAVALLGLESVLSVRPEISLFSYRPDIIVVMHKRIGIILVVEVKKPGLEVFTSHSVGGQVYDYLVGMFAGGVSRPFAVLSSYDRMVIAHLDDNAMSKKVLERVAGDIENDLTKEIAFLEGDNGQPININEPQAHGSPLSKLNTVVSDQKMPSASDGLTERSEDNNDDGESDDEAWSRALCYTKVIERVDILKAMVLAIRCGIKSCMESPSLPLPSQGSSPSHGCARVNEKGMVWRDLPSTVVIDYNSFPSSTTESFYLLRDLGKGSSGRAFLMCSPGGKALVAKFFLSKAEESHRSRESPYTRQQQRKSLMNARKGEAEKEMNMWTTLYGDEYQVRVQQLHQHWCLLLPYFDPLTTVEARQAALPQIRQILEAFKSRKRRYKTDDIRWRHVGIRQNKICLFDLGSLEECKDDPGAIDVDAQLRILEESAKYPEAP
jgi:Family of unknown function (DUF5898)